MILLVLCCLPQHGLAQICEGSEACLRLIEQHQRSTRSLSARITQTKILSLMDQPLVSRGRFAFRAPDSVLWQLDDPAITVRIDAQGIHIPNRPEVEKEISAMAPFHRVMREMSGLFTGDLAGASGAFTVTAGGEGDAIVVKLVPRQDSWKRLFQQIKLTFAAPHFVIRQIRMEEALGDRVEIEFSDLHRNDAEADAAMLPR